MACPELTPEHTPACHTSPTFSFNLLSMCQAHGSIQRILDVVFQEDNLLFLDYLKLWCFKRIIERFWSPVDVGWAGEAGDLRLL